MYRLKNSWDKVLGDEFEKPYFLELCEFLKKEYAERTIYPPKQRVFSALKTTEFDDVKVVVLGQDPYHGEGQAHGPLPLSGFISAVGRAPTNSVSPPTRATHQAMPSIRKSIAPEARNTPMATSIATR